MQMPFGKYIGEEIEDIPDSYLYWLMTIDLRSVLKLAVERELDRRENGSDIVFNVDYNIPPELKYFVTEIIETGFKSSAMKHHPDRGGRIEDMKTLNTARYWLKQRLGLNGAKDDR